MKVDTKGKIIIKHEIPIVFHVEEEGVDLKEMCFNASISLDIGDISDGIVSYEDD